MKSNCTHLEHGIQSDILYSGLLCFIDLRIVNSCLAVYMRKDVTSHHTVSKKCTNVETVYIIAFDKVERNPNFGM